MAVAMLGGRREYERWLPVAGDEAARFAERSLVWLRGGLIAAIGPTVLAGVLLPRPTDANSPDPMGLPFTYSILVLVVTGVTSFVLQLRLRNAVCSYWHIDRDEQRTLKWRHPEAVKQWLAEHRPDASTETSNSRGD